MAKRDVELIIKAKDEASRALNSVADLLGQLDIKQKGTAASGKSMAGSLADAAQQLAQFERVTGLVVAASNRAEAAINGQRNAIKSTAAELAAVQNQLAAARTAIEAAQRNVVDARLGGGSGAAEVAALQAAQQGARDLEAQQAKLTRTLAAQEGVLTEQQRGFQELASNANTAEAALASFGDESARASLKAAAAAEDATTALRAQTAAQEDAARAARARAFFASEPTVSSPKASTTLLADQLRALDTEEKQAEAARDRELAEEALTAQLVERARIENALAQLTTNTAPKASTTLLADQLRLEEEAAVEADRRAAALQRLQTRLDPLAAIEHRLATETQFLAKAQRDGLLTTHQYEKALEALQIEANNARAAVERVGRGEKGKVALFGLKPYELTNLGYQVNDLVTQVASGTSVMQAFAQQGGQILQLMPQIGARIIAAFKSPPILIAAAAIGTIAIAIKQASDESERLRKVEGILETMGDKAGVTAQQLAGVVKEVENIGFSSGDALALTRDFASQGLNTDYLLDVAKAAQDLADVTGEKLPEAASKITSAFSGGYKAIAEFDDSMQFLTASEREQIRAMFDSGKAAEARSTAFKIFEREMDDQATKSNGRWTQSIRTLDRAFNDLLTTLGDTDFAQSFVRSMEDVVQGVENAFTRIEDAQLGFVERRIKELEKFRKDNPRAPGSQVVTLFGEDNVDQELAKLRARRDELLKQRQATGDLRNEESQAAQKRDADALKEIQRERQLANARTAAQRIALAGEKALRDARDQNFSEEVAQAKKRQAIERQRREEQKKAEQDRKRDEAEFADRIANNGRTGLLNTAAGFTGQNETRNRGSLTEFFRQNGINVDPKMTAWCAAFVNAVLATNGLPTVNQATGGNNLASRDFLAYGSKVTKPEPGDIVILKGHVGFFKGFTGNGDVRVLGGNQGNGVNTSTFKSSQVLGFRRAPSAGDVAEDQAKAEEKRLKTQEDFNREIDEEVAKRNRSIAFVKAQQGLSGEALLDEQRRQAIEEAVFQAQQDALQKDVTLSKEREQAIRDSVVAEFDLQHARDRANAALKDVTTERDALLERLQLAERMGDAPGIAKAEAAIGQLDEAMRKAIDHAIELMKALGDTPENRAAILNLQTARDSIGLDARDRTAQRLQKPIADLQAVRNSLLEQIDVFQNLGETGTVDQLREQLRGVDEQLLGAIDSAITFWQTQTGPEAQAALLQFETLRQQILASQNEFVISAGQIQDAFANSLTDAMQLFIDRVAEGRDVISSLAEAALTFAAEFLQKLADIGLQMLALKLAKSIGFGSVDLFGGDKLSAAAPKLLVASAALGASGASLTSSGTLLSLAGTTMTGAATGMTAAAIAWRITAAEILAAGKALNDTGGDTTETALKIVGSLFHSGGIAGMATRTRNVSPAWFASAMRYHSGGIAGLRPNEMPAILQRGEEILTRGDPRHRWNSGGSSGGGAAGANVNLKAVLVHDPAEALDAALGSSAGEKTVIGFLRRNAATVRAALDQ